MSEKTNLRFIKDYVDMNRIDNNAFNLIASGTGTGKSTLIMKDLLGYFPNIDPKDIIFVTSRSMIVEQQSKEEGVSKLYRNNCKLINYWNGELESEEINQSEIHIMTYDVLIDIIRKSDFNTHDTLENVKIVIFDECHTIFSDTFIADSLALKIWTSFMIKKRSKIFIGLTATPHIIEYEIDSGSWGVNLNKLNENILINYKAKQLICTDFNTIPYLITSNRLKGKTIIMCYTVEDCYKLKDQIPNAAVLVSKNSKYFNHNMERLRDYVVNNANLPDTYFEDIREEDGSVTVEETPLRVLITTSTLREGVNIQSASNVKNVISCFTDELHIIQFAGRCRHNIENLVIAETFIRSDNRKQNDYLMMRRKQFKEFMRSESDGSEWFDTIKHIVDIPLFMIYKVKFSKEMMEFINFMNNKWLIPIGASEDNLSKYYIYKQEDKDKILLLATQLKVLNVKKDMYTFNRVMDFMRYHLGYKIEEGRTQIDKKQTRYRMVIEYDQNKGDFHYLDCSDCDSEDD